MAPPSRQPPLRQAPGSSGKICNFFLKGTCTFGNNCYNEHTQPQQQPMDFRSSTNTRFNNTNNRGRGTLQFK
uniref:C3H1-type domain-containing protein n=1 Tax=Panagrolaimus superbus TaxID=310955 RepID=A0A914Y5L1_9BILA